ncbi:PLD nuclease N-terminal domain-containing protein [Streptomyces sp. HNM0663]|uniref:PLD nuclease N-terminal domain-containing protein n=1 Tax=Streptomyces chengmaiensis TaxID=3040919 RepID=A0ABT6HSU1_9ACTN|nr:PLD nuclease N-terminal domain-containing protein [Streptomyces chengmaiensis]MDH2391761.1 PLD nuclease N-terminal domain-containing protein [Streptomyces chengmaiensis]
MLRALMFLVPLALTIYAFIDCLNTPEDEAKHLPKIAWVFIILLFWIVGPIVWLVAGKTRGASAGGRTASERRRRGNRATWVAPDDNPEFLQSLREEKKGEKKKEENKKDESLLKDWEADLRRREEELKRREQGEDPKQP